MEPSDELEVQRLLATTRTLVGQAHKLSRSINETVDELQEFHDDLARGAVTEYHERRKSAAPYEGEDRRA